MAAASDWLPGFQQTPPGSGQQLHARQERRTSESQPSHACTAMLARRLYSVTSSRLIHVVIVPGAMDIGNQLDIVLKSEVQAWALQFSYVYNIIQGGTCDIKVNSLY